MSTLAHRVSASVTTAGRTRDQRCHASGLALSQLRGAGIPLLGNRSGGNWSGVISLTRIHPDQSEVGFWVGPGFWNTGFASEAVAALVAANPHNARTLFAEVFQDNPGSARVLTNCGFEYLGDAESWSVARGARVPTWTYVKKIA